MSEATAMVENEHFLLLTTERSACAVVRLRGAVDISSASELGQALSRLIRLGMRDITIDMTETTLIDSAALGALVLAQKQARVDGGDVSIAGARGEVRRVFEVTGLDRVLSLRESVEEI